ncbi:hypothetical protein PHLCEN_2v11897 [Hermanssonia centrifuga]|uniref:Uncharacterized protein n=1 Tax=Hermanssonia centrifuga TaxID=98765 RepID=A0A2R6NIU1_9APHY|nr:hypothetical protein PHLCEN_2v11897 [Hermanssonia centrifuga]
MYDRTANTTATSEQTLRNLLDVLQELANRDRGQCGSFAPWYPFSSGLAEIIAANLQQIRVEDAMGLPDLQRVGAETFFRFEK